MTAYRLMAEVASRDEVQSGMLRMYHARDLDRWDARAGEGKIRLRHCVVDIRTSSRESALAAGGTTRDRNDPSYSFLLGHAPGMT